MFRVDPCNASSKSHRHRCEYNQLVHRDLEKPMCKYAIQFMEMEQKVPHLLNADVIACRNYVLENGPFIDVPDLRKSNAEADKARKEGDRLFQSKEYEDALMKYNESICWAEAGSKQLALGYGKRSSFYCDVGEYEFALANVILAKKHNYPKQLMPKLLERELLCKKKIRIGQSTNATPRPRTSLTVEVNPKIPFIAKGIRMERLPGYGRSMIANENFRAGDVILDEKPILTRVGMEFKYRNCNYCTEVNFHSLIPCPNCISVMYCGEECLKKSHKFQHRFECGISEKLHHLSYGHTNFGARMFFYGLTLFNDNVDEMMEFCEGQERTGADPFSLDYTTYDPLEEFKMFHMAKLPTNKVFQRENLFRLYSALYYSVFMKHPLVKSLFASEVKKKFMARYFLDYLRALNFLVIGSPERYTHHFYSIASVCNHSCDPNVLDVCESGQLKFIALRPIAKDEQLFVSYGPRFETEPKRSIRMVHTDFECLCVVCDEKKMKNWLAKAITNSPVPLKHMLVVDKIMDQTFANEAAKLNALQQFVQRHGHLHPQESYEGVLKMYRAMLTSAAEENTKAAARKMAVINLVDT